ncbi:hypothetical protein AMELA_G00058320 [Ameiurus melas]|uniref:Ig-like domain-containing protein n=1 Tax=Ameiurus melas TaxID=219545 RepID=A0A7J6B3V0_AMEME|nr:hypothetical protein AMELA_G00058320 [Ameiurus melas]
MEFSRLAVMLLLISLIPVPHAQGSPKAVVSKKPDTLVYSGDRVTFRCDVQGGGYSEWTYSWYRNNYTLDMFFINRFNTNSTKQEITIKSVKDSDSGNYTCRGQSSDSQSSEISDAVTLTVSGGPQVVLSVSPRSWLTEGDSVTLSCEVTNSSTNWTFRLYKLHNEDYRLVNLSDSISESGNSYTISPAALKHTGVYECRAKRGEQVHRTYDSNIQPLWITGKSPPVSLIINPNRTQHFTDNSLSLSCENQSNSTGWRVIRYTDSKRLSNCSGWGSVTGSTCEISLLSTSDAGVYWCESKSGENSNPVNITVHERGESLKSWVSVRASGPSGVEAPFSVLMLISSVVTASCISW